MIVPPMILLGEVPSIGGFIGIILIVLGAVLINLHGKTIGIGKKALQQIQNNRKGVQYFLVTAGCYTLAPTAAKICIQESSVLFTSFLSHLLIAIGFLVILIISRETPLLTGLLQRKNAYRFLAILIAAGILLVLENGSINAALAEASVAEVFALKRLMPLFAFGIGVFYFQERECLLKKSIATILMILGAIGITAL
jgi:drug/metabolite transporter (DMT)-like permease